MFTSKQRPLCFAICLAPVALALSSQTARAAPTPAAPGHSTYEPIAVETGLTPDPSFGAWANTPIPTQQGVTFDPGFGAWASQAWSAISGCLGRLPSFSRN